MMKPTPNPPPRFVSPTGATCVRRLLVPAFLALLSVISSAQTDSPVQSAARPFKLGIVDTVKTAASDEKSAVFQKTVLPELAKFLDLRLSERSVIDDTKMALDPASLKMKTASDVRVYFIGEGAGYRNTLGFNTSGGSVTSGNPELIFPDASSPVSGYNPAKSVKRTGTAPLVAGDFVDLGKLAGGTMLDFFLIANGANGGRTIFSTEQSVNGDGINHVVAFASRMTGSPYLIIGFEDLWGGGDRDFNDLLFAVDVGAANVRALTATPEPAIALTLVSFLGLALRRRRRLPLLA